MLTSIILILWWLFACYGLIVSKFKSVKDEFDVIIPYQFVIGLLLLIMFVGDLFTLNLTNMTLLFGLLQILATFTKLALWFVLSYGMITRYFLTKESDAKEKTDKIYNKLISIQVPLGIIAIILGLLGIILIVL